MSSTNLNDIQNKALRPASLSRQGEFVAWTMTLLVIITWIFLSIRGYNIHLLIIVLGVFIFLSALALSLGNWVDRRTVIRITDEGIHFENGLRCVNFHWEQINQVEVYPSRMGKKVHVRSNRTHFDFRTSAEIKSRGNVKGYLGFREGDGILAHILEKAHFEFREQSGSGYCYKRKSI